PNTAMHPFSQSGTAPPFGTAKALNALLAPRGTNTKLFAALAATECAVLAGLTFATGGTLYVGTDWISFPLSASITPSGVAPFAGAAGRGRNGLPLPVA